MNIDHVKDEVANAVNRLLEEKGSRTPKEMVKLSAALVETGMKLYTATENSTTRRKSLSHIYFTAREKLSQHIDITALEITEERTE